VIALIVDLLRGQDDIHLLTGILKATVILVHVCDRCRTVVGPAADRGARGGARGVRAAADTTEARVRVAVAWL
jgi:hypothetical protein